MSTHRHIDKICCVILVLTLLSTLLFVNAGRFGVQKASAVMGYEEKLFDTSSVHTVNIIMDDWDAFLEGCQDEEYETCTVVIDNEAYKNVAIRAKGNTSLTQVASYGNDRYSFKIEFDHYDSSKSYHGLDKLCLNNIIQDNTYMKDYLCYQMMRETGLAAPLCSYAYITVNGEDFGLYLAVEGIEESFLQRNYGKDYGELYKPDSQSMGGGRGNGEKFDMDAFLNTIDSDDSEAAASNDGDGSESAGGNTSAPFGQMPSGAAGEASGSSTAQGMQPGNMPPGGMKGTPPALPDGSSPDSFGSDGMPGGMTPPTAGEEGESGAGEATQPDGEAPDGRMGQPGALSPGDQAPGGFSSDGMPGGMTNNGGDDVLLKYIDDQVESYANIFDNAKTDPSEADKARLIESLKNLSDGEELADTVDVEAVIRYFVVHNFVLNFDSYTGSMIHNYYLYEKDGQLQMLPWDYNLAFGGFQSMGDATSLVNYPIDSPVSGGTIEDRPMLAWIFADETYTALYHQYFSEFISDWFDSGNFEEMMDRTVSLISPYVEKDPTKFCTYAEFETGASTLKTFCLLRAESISGQLAGTIGSTSDMQESSTLIDADGIQIQDMGSMNGSAGGGMGQPGDMSPGGEAPGGMPDAQPQEGTNSGAAQSSAPTQASDTDQTASSQMRPDSPSDTEGQTTGGARPQKTGGTQQGGMPPAFGNGESSGTEQSASAGQAAGGTQQGGMPPAFGNGESSGTEQSASAGQTAGGTRQGDSVQTSAKAADSSSAEKWILLAVSAACLLLGLGVAVVYKRRRG